jgi:glycosyltransferase involved in cell wall biosynthesis
MTKDKVFEKKSKNGRILAIIPCYNEEHTIGSVILKTKHYVDEALVVDDGGSDDTAKIAKEAGAIVIIHETNRGKGNAIKTGFRYAVAHDFDYVVTIDGDGQHNPAEIPLLVGNIMDNGHDISLGFRVGHDTEMPKWRKVGKRILDYATSFGSGGFVTDSQCGFRAFNRKAIKDITPRLKGNAFSVESEQLIKAHDLSLGLVNTKVTCKYNNLKNTSTKNPTSHGFSVLSYVIWLVAEKRPLLFIGVPGFVLVLLGIFFGIQTLQYYNQTHVFLISYAILVSIFSIIGALGMFMGLMLNVLPNILKRVRLE